MTKAKVIELIYRSLNMLLPEECSRNMLGPEPLLARLRNALGENDNKAVVCFEEHSKLFSLVYAALIILADELRSTGGDLVISTSDNNQLLVMKMLGLTKHIKVFESLETALASSGWQPTGSKTTVYYEVVD